MPQKESPSSKPISNRLKMPEMADPVRPEDRRTVGRAAGRILDLFEKNRITIQDAKTVLWTLLTAIYEDELIEEPQGRETIIENIERQKEQLLVNILGPR
jgi:hypothetical protein